MHNEQKKVNKENFIKLDSLIYNSQNKMKDEFYKNNNTIIQKLFFFETFHDCKCSKCGDDTNYFINCVLELELEKDKKEIKINDFLNNLSQNKKMCVICQNKSLTSKILLNSCPQFLIIVIKPNNKLKENFQLTEKIELKDYITKDNKDAYKYELVSFIKNPPIEEEKKDGIIYCKSPVNKEWYKYEGLKCEKMNIKDIIKNEKSIPYLLIYKNECVDKINNINKYFK